MMGYLKGLWNKISGKKTNVGAMLMLVLTVCRTFGVDLPENSEDIAMKAAALLAAIGLAHKAIKVKK